MVAARKKMLAAFAPPLAHNGSGSVDGDISGGDIDTSRALLSEHDRYVAGVEAALVAAVRVLVEVVQQLAEELWRVWHSSSAAAPLWRCDSSCRSSTSFAAVTVASWSCVSASVCIAVRCKETCLVVRGAGAAHVGD